MIISVVAAKIWYLKKCMVFIGPPCIVVYNVGRLQYQKAFVPTAVVDKFTDWLYGS